MKNRIQWIDIWKGIGIIIVVTGHIVQAPLKNYIFWFHMPLFFFLSGYLYRPNHNYYTFLKQKSLSFLVPYIIFLILLTIPEYFLTYLQAKDSSIFLTLGKMTLYKIAGGGYIYGWFDVFWFITCLFFTQQLYNFIYCKFQSHSRHKCIVIASVILAYLLAMIDYWFFPQMRLPWSLDTVLFALPFYFLGHFSTQYLLNNKKIIILALVLFALAIMFNNRLPINLDIDFKKKEYGFIILNIILAMSGIIITQSLAILMTKINYVSKIFMSLGKSSLIIMYLHQFFRSFLIETPVNDISKVFICLLIPYLIYQVLRQFSVTRKFLLGDFRIKTLL